MKRKHLYTISALVLFLAVPVMADTTQKTPYTVHGIDAASGGAIHIEGTPDQIRIFLRWLDQIAAVPKGSDTLEKIAASGHKLLIRHSKNALLSAGRTLTPMSANLINGKGESVQILFDAEIPDQGSHMVFDGRRRLIEYSAIQNLYHELAHAMHMMNGTWRYFKSERQAIEEENLFRKDLAAIQGKKPAYRMRKSGVLIGDVNDSIIISEWFGPTLVQKHRRETAPNSLSSSGVEP
jgi:hypothetical protein